MGESDYYFGANIIIELRISTILASASGELIFMGIKAWDIPGGKGPELYALELLYVPPSNLADWRSGALSA